MFWNKCYFSPAVLLGGQTFAWLRSTCSLQKWHRLHKCYPQFMRDVSQFRTSSCVDSFVPCSLRQKTLSFYGNFNGWRGNGHLDRRIRLLSNWKIMRSNQPYFFLLIGWDSENYWCTPFKVIYFTTKSQCWDSLFDNKHLHFPAIGRYILFCPALWIASAKCVVQEGQRCRNNLKIMTKSSDKLWDTEWKCKV